jgi:hypothetical protein
MALLAAAFSLPAAAQEIKIAQTPQGLMAQGTYKHVTPGTNDPLLPVSFFTLYNNFGAQSPLCVGCPPSDNLLAGINQNGFIYTDLTWQPGGWLILGPDDPNYPGIGGTAVAVPFVTPTSASCAISCSVEEVRLPLQQTGATGTRNNFTVSVWADDGLGVPSSLVNTTGPGFVNVAAVPVFPSCCTNSDTVLADFTYSAGKYLGPLSPGSGYWVVVDADLVIPNNAATTSEGVWAFTQYANYGRLTPNSNGGVWCTPSSVSVACANLGLANGGLATGSTLPAMKITGVK